MEIKSLKEKIEKKIPITGCTIFVYTDNNFVALQYVHEIVQTNNFILNKIEELAEIPAEAQFFIDDKNILYLYNCNVLDTDNFPKNKNIIIITNKIKKTFENDLHDYIIEIPKLEDWQIKNYILANLTGFTKIESDKLYNICNGNIFRISQEVEKLKLFNENHQKYLLDQFINDSMFSDIENKTIFNFIDAIIKRNKVETVKAYKNLLMSSDLNVFSFLVNLYNNIKNIIKVQLSPAPSPESCGLSNKQYWAIKYSCGFYNKEELLSIFNIITDVDRKIKTGGLDPIIAIDYI